jgi:hypothetical protein
MTMQRESIPITDRAAWLNARIRDLTASRFAALFDVHPFLNRNVLAAHLRGQSYRYDNDAMRAGRILEPGIAVALAEMYPDWHLDKMPALPPPARSSYRRHARLLAGRRRAGGMHHHCAQRLERRAAPLQDHPDLCTDAGDRSRAWLRRLHAEAAPAACRSICSA